MSEYEVTLEMDERGRCMAHVRQLPGCVVVGPSRDEALAELPGAVQKYIAWLREHGEDVPEESGPIGFNVVDSFSGIGPFDPGDQASLFDWERDPLPPEEMDLMFRLSAYNRRDLLEAVRPLSPGLRQWRPDVESMSVEQILRHVGDAEQWYVSRLVSPETLPEQWADDEGMPVITFLKMTRETAVERLRRLTTEELGQVFTPTHFTQKLGEPWTARKAMRRFLEHEREHTAHVRKLLESWRSNLLARLAAERADLLWQLRGLDEATLSQTPAEGAWTVKDLLAHLGAWDAFHAERIRMVQSGRIEQVKPVGGREEMDAYNMTLYQRFKDVPLEQVVDLLQKERADFLATLAGLTDEELHRQIRLPWGWRTRMRVWAAWRHRHDASHARALRKWRRRLPAESRRKIGPSCVLSAILKATHQEFAALASLLPAAECDRRPVCGEWTMKDLVGHLADWEEVGVAALRQSLSGKTPQYSPLVDDVERFNQERQSARRGQPWEQVWADYQRVRRELLTLVESASAADLSAAFETPWGTMPNAYLWVMVWPRHEREHAAALRFAMQLPGTPKRLQQVG